MAFVATCMDKAVEALVAGAGLAKRGASKVPEYAPKSEKGQNQLTSLGITGTLLAKLDKISKLYQIVFFRNLQITKSYGVRYA